MSFSILYLFSNNGKINATGITKYMQEDGQTTSCHSSSLIASHAQNKLGMSWAKTVTLSCLLITNYSDKVKKKITRDKGHYDGIKTPSSCLSLHQPKINVLACTTEKTNKY